MTVVLKTSKSRMFSTVLDVVRRGRYIRTESFDFSDTEESYAERPIMTDGEIESFILNQDGVVLTYLNQKYEGAEGLRTTRWVTTPYASPKNTGSSKLIAATLVNTTDPYTAFWTVRFTNATAFDVTSSLEGSQGSGATDADFTSTNTELQIGTNAWNADLEKPIQEGDEFYFSIVDVYPIINKISSDLATCAILQELYSEAVPNSSEYSLSLCKKAMELLEKLADPDSVISLTETTDFDLSSTGVDYNIGALGEDKSDYLTKNILDL